MIGIDVVLRELVKADGCVGYLHPEVKIELDAEANVDLPKLKKFREKLEAFINKGLNECLIEN